MIEGSLLLNPEAGFAELSERLEGTGLTPFLRHDDDGRTILVLVPADGLHTRMNQPSRAWVDPGLLIGTPATTTWANAGYHAVP